MNTIKTHVARYELYYHQLFIHRLDSQAFCLLACQLIILSVVYVSFQMVTRTKKIFVGGLSAPTTLEDVKSYFEQFGPVSTDNYAIIALFRLRRLFSNQQ